MRALAVAASLALATGATTATAPRSTIFIASDSTAADYPPARYPQMGWGMMLRCGLSPRVAVDNRAVGGLSTRTFIGEGRLDALLAALRPGDTVLIQFGHNDANRARPERFVEAATGYRDNLRRFVATIRARGGQPVLLTPVAQRIFAGGEVAAGFADYSAVVREVAAETRTPLIDLEALSRAWVARAGEEGARPYYLHYTAADHLPAFPDGIDDDTHLSELGARGVANLVAGALRDLRLPVSRQVLRARPALTRAAPLGHAGCA